MATRRQTGEEPSTPRRPATTPEARENQLVAAAFDLAEKQIRDGSATSQLITHFLKLGSTRERMEQERLKSENELLKSKIEALASASRVEELYSDAIAAMQSYRTFKPGEDDFD